ncbi:MAG: DUF6266 family protein [Paludibacteraceae bacterium]
MAKSQNPLTGKMSGTVGNFVTSTYRGQNVIRSKAFNPKDANSEAQQKLRNMFKLLKDEYSSLAQFVNGGFPNRPQNQSPWNAFMAVNLPDAFDVSGENPVIDYAKLILSKGPLPGVSLLTAETGADGVTVAYKPMASLYSPSTDIVKAVLETTANGVFSAQKARGTLAQDSLLIPVADLPAEEVKCMYLLVTSADKTKTSRSLYVPMI